MIGQFPYRTGLPMFDLFFNGFATIFEIQRALASKGIMAAPMSTNFGYSDQGRYTDQSRGTDHPYPKGRAASRQAAGSECKGLPR